MTTVSLIDITYTDTTTEPETSDTAIDRDRQKQPEEEWDRSGMTTVLLISR